MLAQPFISPPLIAPVCDFTLCPTFGTISGDRVSGINVPSGRTPASAPSHRASWTQIWPRTLSNEWFSWKITTTCRIGEVNGWRLERLGAGGGCGTLGSPNTWSSESPDVTYSEPFASAGADVIGPTAVVHRAVGQEADLHPAVS